MGVRRTVQILCIACPQLSYLCTEVGAQTVVVGSSGAKLTSGTCGGFTTPSPDPPYGNYAGARDP